MNTKSRKAMSKTVQFILALLILAGCHPSGVKVVSSPDKKLLISFEEKETIWLQPGIMEWTNIYQYKSGGRWQSDSSWSLTFEYYCDDASLMEYYADLHREEWSELETGIKPVKIEQISLSNGTPIYFVYALTYSDAAYHDYYYSYTALCIEDGKIRKYPIFRNVMDLARPGSDIIIINPASIDFDFTTHPAYYEYWLDHKVLDVKAEDRIRLNPQTGELSLADGELRFSFENDIFSNITF